MYVERCLSIHLQLFASIFITNVQQNHSNSIHNIIFYFNSSAKSMFGKKKVFSISAVCSYTFVVLLDMLLLPVQGCMIRIFIINLSGAS